MNARVSFLEAFSDACESLSLPYSSRNDLIQEISRMSDAELVEWIRIIDESPHPLLEWLDALVYFKGWLEQSGQNRKFQHQIEYLSCCIQGFQGMGNRISLQGILDFYLEKHGIK